MYKNVSVAFRDLKSAIEHELNTFDSENFHRKLTEFRNLLYIIMAVQGKIYLKKLHLMSNE